MQNQPFTQFDASRHPTEGGTSASHLRLGMLSGLLLLIVMGIAARVVYVQAAIAEQFLAPWQATKTIEIDIPARSGRILTRDGVVLAYDETQYDIAMDYRWLESPFDPVWLREQIYARLNAEQRQDSAIVDQIEEELARERENSFRKLSQLTGIPISELLQRAKKTQSRIERMVNAVEANRNETIQGPVVQQLRLEQGLSGIFKTIQSELTTPPRRYSSDPIILKEELQPHPLIYDVPLEVVAAIKSTPNQFPGVHVRDHSSRVYPLDHVAVHAIGLRRRRSGAETATAEGGIEQQFDTQLSGRRGQRIEERNRQGDLIREELSLKPQEGEDVRLSLDSRVQQTAESLLDQALDNSQLEPQPQGGAILVMDVWTGDLLAMASAPRYSLTNMLKPTVEQFDELQNDSRRPFFDRTTQMALPPGSVFKLVTAIAALEEKTTSSRNIFECHGYLNHPSRHRCQIFRNYGLGHGEIRLDDALCQSCNVFFFDQAQKLGPQRLIEWSNRLGFGTATGIDLPYEVKGSVPEKKLTGTTSRRRSSELLHVAIGQGDLLTSPLQITKLIACIANGGYLVTPQLVTKQGAEDGATLSKVEGLSTETLQTVREGMQMVVHHERGTGVAALTPSMTIAAKTGTAEVAGKPDHAWFAGFAPVESPRLAFCVVLEHGGSGGDIGPIIRELMTELIGLGYLQPQWHEETSDLTIPEGPSVTNSPVSRVP